MPPSQRRPSSTSEAFRACDELILCESVIDALRSGSTLRNVTSPYGTNGPCLVRCCSVQTHAYNACLIAFDADDKRATMALTTGEPLGHAWYRNDFRLKVTAAAKTSRYAS